LVRGAFLGSGLQVAPCTAPYFSLFAQRKVSKRKRTPASGPALRSGSVRSIAAPGVGLQGPSLALVSLSRHPCRSTPYAAIPLTLLKGNLLLPARPCMEKRKAKAKRRARQSRLPNLQATRTPFPFRRPNAGVAQEVARQDAERGTKGQGRPFVTCLRSSAGVRGVLRSKTRMQGWPSFWLLFLGQTRKSDAPCKAQPVVRAEESAKALCQIQRHQGA